MAPVSRSTTKGQDLSLAGLVEEFAKSAQFDPRGDIEFSLLKDLVEAFTRSPVMVRRAMRELLARSPSKFFSSALQLLKMGVAGPGGDYMVGLLLENDMLLMALADPRALQVDVALALARHLYRLDPHLDAKLLKQILREDRVPDDRDVEALERILLIVDAVSDGTRLVPILMKLQRHPDGRIRSKSARIVARAHRNAEWLGQQLNMMDPRVRSNAIEGLLIAAPSEKELALLWGAATDPNHRVATTALLVLARNGDQKALEELVKAVGHPTELMRAGAAWALGQYGDPEYLGILQQMARGDSGTARRMAIKASAMLRKVAAERERGKVAAERKRVEKEGSAEGEGEVVEEAAAAQT